MLNKGMCALLLLFMTASCAKQWSDATSRPDKLQKLKQKEFVAKLDSISATAPRHMYTKMAHPTSNGLMNACEEAIKKSKIDYQRNGTYVVMEGPQFSTLAESNLYRSWNADVIGMTNMPEAKLAREAEIRYASVSMVTDFDCWHPDHENVDVQQVIKVLLGNAEKAKVMIKNLIDNFEDHIEPNDPTNNCLDVAIITAPEKRTKKTIDKLKNVAGRVLNK